MIFEYFWGMGIQGCCTHTMSFTTLYVHYVVVGCICVLLILECIEMQWNGKKALEKGEFVVQKIFHVGNACSNKNLTITHN